MFNYIKKFENWQPNPFPNTVVKELVYHTTTEKFTYFDVDMIGSANPQTSLEGFYFGDIKPNTNNYVAECYLNITNPLIIDMNKTYYDSMSIQWVLSDAIESDGGAYLIEDMLEYELIETMDEGWEKLSYWRENCDGIILKNCNYASHRIEYIIMKFPENEKQSDEISNQIKIINWS